MKCMNLLKVIEEQEETIIRQSEIISEQSKTIRELAELILQHEETVPETPGLKRLQELQGGITSENI